MTSGVKGDSGHEESTAQRHRAEEIQQLLTNGSPDVGTNILSELALLGVKYLGQLGMEQEQTDLLGRGHYERAEEPKGYRNGYEERKVATAEGPVGFRVPQVRGTDEPFRPKILDFILGNSEVLEKLVVEMYARGLSTRDVEDCFRDEAGNPMISRTAVSEITDQLWEDFQQFCTRDLSGIDLQYLFLDAVYESLRRYGAKEGVLAAWGTTTDGTKQLLHLAVGNKETEQCWTRFLPNKVARGLRAPTSVTSDGVHMELRLGPQIQVGRKRVARLMRLAGLAGACHRRRKGCTRAIPSGLPTPT